MVTSRKAWRSAGQTYRKSWFRRIVTPWGLGILPYLTLCCLYVPHPGHFHTWSSSEFGQNKAPEGTVLDLKYFWVPYPSSIGMWFILHLFRTAPGSCSILFWKSRKKKERKEEGRRKKGTGRNNSVLLSTQTSTLPLDQFCDGTLHAAKLFNKNTQLLLLLCSTGPPRRAENRGCQRRMGSRNTVSNVPFCHLQHGSKHSVTL